MGKIITALNGNSMLIPSLSKEAMKHLRKVMVWDIEPLKKPVVKKSRRKGYKWSEITNAREI